MQFKHQAMKNNDYNGYIKWKTFAQKSKKKNLLNGKTFYTRTLHAGKFTIFLTGTAQENSASRYFSTRKQHTY